ncbi:MAG: sulfatase-like hydrolase/transferase [Caldilineales bacterium]
MGRQIQGPVRSGLGRPARADLRTPEEAGDHPAGYRATARPDALPAWDSLNDAQKKLYARQMEVFAGFSENADWNVGRLLDAVEALGDLDNTLVIYIWGDNGASMKAPPPAPSTR